MSTSEQAPDCTLGLFTLTSEGSVKQEHAGPFADCTSSLLDLCIGLAGDWDCSACGASNFARRGECFKCGEPK